LSIFLFVEGNLIIDESICNLTPSIVYSYTKQFFKINKLIRESKWLLE
jgi:hypothetical protein